ncbi:hypothetical protein B5M10_07475 [Pluralibacter gergoviae]|uniref:DUF3592 domain-containing protein n=1 Tax=Pluralibacter gergoviae TaxID=61647 RepID=UPI000907F1D0|nr:DUF3592 domain-containing protein [Pluralibacter gergoviae]OUR02978.1 hypothetical protein B5M10_07475 [Pluralibacter gergoviae]
MKFIANIIVIAVVILFAYIIVSLLIRDAKNKKLRDAVISDGISTVGVITDVRSRNGGNSGFINITLQFSYQTEEGQRHHGKADAVIDAMSSQKYQPGQQLHLHYSKREPEKFVVDIPHPDLRRK